MIIRKQSFENNILRVMEWLNDFVHTIVLAGLAVWPTIICITCKVSFVHYEKWVTQKNVAANMLNNKGPGRDDSDLCTNKISSVARTVKSIPNLSYGKNYFH